MELLDPFMEIILKGISSKTDENGLILQVNLDNPQVSSELLQASGALERKESEVPRKDTRAR